MLLERSACIFEGAARRARKGQASKKFDPYAGRCVPALEKQATSQLISLSSTRRDGTEIIMRLHKLLALALVVVTPLGARAQNISTVAGGGPANNISPTAVSVGAVAAVRQDSLGNTYILDNYGGRVYRIDHATGLMSVFAGNGTNGYNGDGIVATNAAMSGPSGMCIDANNNVYVADSDNGIIREIPITTAGGKTANHIYTVAGVQTETNFTYGGDGGLATNANLHFPDGCSFDSHGNLYIADRGNNAIRVVIGVSATAPVGVPGPVSAGNIYEFAGALPAGGNPPAAGVAANDVAARGAALNGPFDVFVDSHDNVWIGLVGNPPPPINPPATASLVRMVPAATGGGRTAGRIYTMAGTTAGTTYNGQNIPATSAQLSAPEGIFVDANGNLFFADIANHVIREVPAVAALGMTIGNIYDVAGTAGHHGESGDGGHAVAATLTFPAGTFVDSTGALLIADSNNDVIRKVDGTPADYAQRNISLFAGNVHLSFGGDGGPATQAELSTPAVVSVDPNSGDIFIGEASRDTSVPAGDVVRRVSAGNITTFAGLPEANGFAGDGGPAISAQLNNPNGTFVDSHGNVFIVDTDNCIVREVVAGTINTIAGTAPGASPVCGFGGDGTPATSVGVKLNKPTGVVVDGSGDIFISDTGNHVIREIPAQTANGMTAGNIYTVAGTAQTPGANGDGGPANVSGLNGPTGMFIDIFGNLFIADTGNNEIREVPASNVTTPNPMTAGNIYTVAGNATLGAGFSGDTGLATSAQLNAPVSMVVDHAGNLFIADTKNHVIREVTASTGNISTVGGTPQTPGFGGDGGPATAVGAVLNTPEGLALNGADLLIADSANQRVRSIAGLATMSGVPVASFDKTTITFPAQLPNTTSTGQVITLTNTGGAPLTPINVTISGANAGNFAILTNTCPSSLAANANCKITVTFTPNATGAFTAAVSIADNAFGSPQLVTLNGTGGSPTATLNPATTLAFTTPQVVGVASTSQPVTVTNNGNVALTITAIAFTGTNSGDFSETDNCPKSPSTLAVSGSCTINVTFKPTATGARSASLSLTDNAANSPQTLSLTGTGVAPGVNLTAASLPFGNQVVGTTSTPAQTVTLKNNGTSALTVTAITVTGANGADFAETDTCPKSPSTIAVNGTCTINVTFTPAAVGARAASVNITDDAAGSPQAIALTGTGTAPAVSFNSPTLTFSNQVVHTASAAQTITLTNNGTAALTITAIAVGGTNSADFAETDTCPKSPSTIAVSGTCTINVTFTPGALGARTASINVTDNAAGSPQAVTLNGTSVAAPPMAGLSSTSLTFADQLVGTTSTTAQTVTLTNNSASALSIAGIAVTGAANGDYSQTNTCGTSVAGNGGKCIITVNFAPSAAGARAASITITDNATPGTQTVTLSGNGYTVSLAAASNGSLSQTIKAGQTATYNLQFTAAGGSPADQISVTVACSGVPALATCNAPGTPVVVTPGTPGTFSITVATTGGSMLAPLPQSAPNMQLPSALRLVPLTMLALLLCIAAMLAWMQSPAGRMRTISFVVTACLVLMPVTATSFLTGCGGGSSSGSPTPTPTSAPTITTQPANQSAPVGQTATFSVVAAGTAPLTYQWQKNGTAVAGATSASYTTPATTVADNGATFAVVVSNSAGNATSSNAKLSLTTPPNTYTITVTSTVSGKAQTSALTLIVQ
jgi:sugar lactone lactonase YvrE